MRTSLALAAVAAGLAVSLGGCTKDGDTFIQQVGGALLSGNFPGAPVTTHMVASDGMALSETGTSVGAGVRYFPSGDGLTGMLLYTSGVGGQQYIYAHFFDGARFTPPVQLAGGNQDPAIASSRTDWSVIFITNAGNARNGDAVILWRQNDNDDFIAANNIGVNRRLYYAYFDRSLAGTPSSGTNGQVRYGIDTVARTIDTQDDTGVDVTCYGVFSDGLHGRTIFAGDAIAGVGQGINFFEQGDLTTFLGVVFIQPTAIGNTPALHYATFNLGTSNTTNAFASPATFPSDGIFAPGAGGDTARDVLETYDGSVIPFYSDVSTGDQNRMWNVYGSAAATSGWLTNSTTLNAVDGNTNAAGIFRGLFGPDEGLVNLVGFLEVSGLNNAADNSLFAVQVDTVGGSAFTPSNDRVELDADTANNGDSPVLNDQSTPAGRPNPEVRINRTGEYCVAVWRQPRGNAAATSDDGHALWTRAIQLTRSGTAPALNTRTSGSGAQQLDGITTGDTTTTDQVVNFKFQEEIGYRSRGKQSNRYALHVLWQQDQTSGTAVDRLRTRQITFTPSTGSGNPAALTLGSERTEDFNDTELANTATAGSPGGWTAIYGEDGGGLGGTAGELILYYVRNITAAASANPASFRAFQKIGGGTPREIGSLIGGTGATREAMGLLVGTTPGNHDIVGSPDHAGTMQHILLLEARTDNTADPGIGNNVALRHRTYNKDDTNTTIENRFFPVVSASSPPADIDNPSGLSTTWPLTAAGSVVQSAFGTGTTVGVVFLQGGRIFYQEYNSTTRSWLTDEGLPAPEIIDHENTSTAIIQGIGINAPVGTGGQDLNRFIVFWFKSLFGSNFRLQARVRD